MTLVKCGPPFLAALTPAEPIRQTYAASSPRPRLGHRYPSGFAARFQPALPIGTNWPPGRRSRIVEPGDGASSVEGTRFLINELPVGKSACYGLFCNSRESIRQYTSSTSRYAASIVLLERRLLDRRFRQWHCNNHLVGVDQVIAVGNDICWIGEWTCDCGGNQVKGYLSSVAVRDGDAWKIRISTLSVIPAPAPPAEAK